MAAELNPALYRFDQRVSRSEVISALAEMPVHLRDLVREADSPKLMREPRDRGWSAFQTLCHVRDAAIVYAARFRWMVFDANPVLPNYDEERWVALSLDRTEDLDSILEELAASRRGLVRLLSRLPDEAWLRTGRHEVAGTIVLEHYVRHQAVHEAMHLEQLREALS